MAENLESVEQVFLANLAPYLASLDDAIAKGAEFAASVKDIDDALDGMAQVAAATAGVVDAAMGQASAAMDAAANKAGDLVGRMDLAGTAADVMAASFDGANRNVSSMTMRLGNLNDRVTDTVAHLMVLDVELDRKKAAFAAVSPMVAALAAALAVANARTTATSVATATATRNTAMWVGGLRLTGAVLHWLVMGTLEVASTAVPAMAALGAAAAGMYPTFVHITDATNNLVTASGSWRQAALNSVGPVHNLGVQMGTLSQHMAPDAYVIFGSVINDLTGKVGAFSGVAQSAGNVLAAFATKLTAELQGPLGNQLAGFFADGVKFMIQWGQVLGNLGHAFLDFASHMAGVGHVLLDVLVALSRALAALASNPLGASLIGLLAAMSAVYRYGQLLVTIFRWMGGSAIVTGIRALTVAVIAAGDAFAFAGGGAAGFRAAALVLAGSLGPVAIAIAAIAAVLAIWWLNTRQVASSTDNLISRVEKMTPTAGNLTHGLAQLMGALLALQTPLDQVKLRMGGSAAFQLVIDTLKLTKAFQQQAQELLNLDAGLAQVHVGMGAVAAGEAALAIQTALADSKVGQLNQALDQYMGLVTGGTSAMAAFTGALSNLTAGTNTVTTILGRTKSVTLSVQDFTKSLSSFAGKGAQAWQNFGQVVGSTAPQLMDWFRQASVLGAAMGTTVSAAALDMTAMMIRFAGSNATAQAEVLAFARAQGLSVGGFAALKKAVPSAAAAQADLAKKVEATTTAMSDLSEMAKDAADALNTQTSKAIATAAMKTSGLDAAISKYQTDLLSGHSSRAQLLSDVDAINRAMATARQIAVATGNAAQPAFAKMAAGANTAQAAFINALNAAHQLQSYINSLHGKSIYIPVIIQSSGLPLGHGFSASSGGGGPGGATRPAGHGGSGGPARPAFLNSALNVAVTVPGGGGGGGAVVVHHHHYTHVEVNNAGSVIAQHDLVRDVVKHVGRATGRNMGNQLNLPGRVR